MKRLAVICTVGVLAALPCSTRAADCKRDAEVLFERLGPDSFQTYKCQGSTLINNPEDINQRGGAPGGVGTPNDPISFSGATNCFKPCELVYIPYLRKFARFTDSLCDSCGMWLKFLLRTQPLPLVVMSDDPKDKRLSEMLITARRTDEKCNNGRAQVKLSIGVSSHSEDIRACMQTLTPSDDDPKYRLHGPILIRGDPKALVNNYGYDATPLFGPNGCHGQTYDDTASPYDTIPDCPPREASVPTVNGGYMASSLTGGILGQANGVIDNTDLSANPIPQILTPTPQENLFGPLVPNDNPYAIPALGKIGDLVLTSFLRPADIEMQTIPPNQAAAVDEGATGGYGGFGNFFGTSTRRRRRVIRA
ncbi:hypothetical protein MMC07_008848 [Pseudocyphellaria aurata]|nr:hypothetical protein [Pseudocyphellaria aurata]